MIINILTIACGLATGFIFVLIIQHILEMLKNLIYKKKAIYKPVKIFTHDNKQFQKIEREEKPKK